MTKKDFQNSLAKLEKKKYEEYFQKLAEQNGSIPKMPYLWARAFSPVFQYCGSILLGVFFGLMVIVFNFFLFVRIFHLNF